jgi:enamine deaminase RidA (YjgF/YER057c/UK114 family)
VKNATQTIYVSGQCSVDEEGCLMHGDDFAGQCRLVFDNILQV